AHNVGQVARERYRACDADADCGAGVRGSYIDSLAQRAVGIACTVVMICGGVDGDDFDRAYVHVAAEFAREASLVRCEVKGEIIARTTLIEDTVVAALNCYAARNHCLRRAAVVL